MTSIASGRSSRRWGRLSPPRRAWGRRSGAEGFGAGSSHAPRPTRSPLRAGGFPGGLRPAHPLAGPSLTLKRSTSRASSRVPAGLLDQALLGAAGVRSSRQSKRRRRSHIRDRAPPPYRPANAGSVSARGSGWPSRPSPPPAAVHAEPVSASLRAPRLPPLELRDEVGISRSSAWCRRRDGSPAPRAESLRAAAARQALRSAARACAPRARSSASTVFRPRNLRASERRGTPTSAPIVFNPSRSSVRTACGDRRNAATDRGARSAAKSLSPRPYPPQIRS